MSAEASLVATRRAVSDGIDDVANSLNHARQETGTAIRQLVNESEALAHRGLDQVREQSLHAKEVATDYVRHEPVKSILMAAALGAALMALVSLLSRNGHSGR